MQIRPFITAVSVPSASSSCQLSNTHPPRRTQACRKVRPRSAPVSTMENLAFSENNPRRAAITKGFCSATRTRPPPSCDMCLPASYAVTCTHQRAPGVLIRLLPRVVSEGIAAFPRLSSQQSTTFADQASMPRPEAIWPVPPLTPAASRPTRYPHASYAEHVYRLGIC